MPSILPIRLDIECENLAGKSAVTSVRPAAAEAENGAGRINRNAHVARLAHDHASPTGLAAVLRQPDQIGCGEHSGIGGPPGLDIEPSDAARIARPRRADRDLFHRRIVPGSAALGRAMRKTVASTIIDGVEPGEPHDQQLFYDARALQHLGQSPALSGLRGVERGRIYARTGVVLRFAARDPQSYSGCRSDLDRADRGPYPAEPQARSNPLWRPHRPRKSPALPKTSISGSWLPASWKRGSTSPLEYRNLRGDRCETRLKSCLAIFLTTKPITAGKRMTCCANRGSAAATRPDRFRPSESGPMKQSCGSVVDPDPRSVAAWYSFASLRLSCAMRKIRLIPLWPVVGGCC